jgi:SAM-dependent methyltransferase
MRTGDQTGGSIGWSQVAEAYAETFAPLCAGTFEAVLAAGVVGDASGLRVLDVGTGTGALARLASQAGADVSAVDPDPEMLRIAARTAPGVLLQQAGLPRLPFPDNAFDTVLVNFVVNHLQDPRAGMAEIARVAAVGARVVVTIWPSGQNVQSRLWAEVIDSSGATTPPSTRLPEDKDFARTTQGLTTLMTDSGLRTVQVRSLLWTHRAPTASLWHGAAAGIGGIGRIVTSQSSDVRAKMKMEYDHRVIALTEHGRLRMDTEALLAVGTKS